MRKPIMILFVVLLCLIGSAPHACAWGGHGGGRGGGHGGHGFGHGGHRFGHGGHGFIGPRLGVSIWPYWSPYWDPYGYPPVVVAPPPQVYVHPAPPIWYYCANPSGYYPYVPQCPGGWQLVSPTPP
jgi:hypothetical protein